MAVFPEDDNLEEEDLFEENREDEEAGEEPLDSDPDLDSVVQLWPDDAKGGAVESTLNEEKLRAELANADPSMARPYAMNANFSPGDLISHEQFGLGIVTRALTVRKIEVMFKDTSKILVMNYTPSSR